MFKTIFTTLEKNTHPKEEEINKISSFIFCKWLGNNPYTIQAANQFNFYDKIPMYNQYYAIKNIFGGKKLYIKYPKNTKDESKAYELIAKHYNVSLEKAKEYNEFLSKDDINKLIEIYDSMKGN